MVVVEEEEEGKEEEEEEEKEEEEEEERALTVIESVRFIWGGCWGQNTQFFSVETEMTLGDGRMGRKKGDDGGK